MSTRARLWVSLAALGGALAAAALLPREIGSPPEPTPPVTVVLISTSLRRADVIETLLPWLFSEHPRAVLLDLPGDPADGDPRGRLPDRGSTRLLVASPEGPTLLPVCADRAVCADGVGEVEPRSRNTFSGARVGPAGYAACLGGRPTAPYLVAQSITGTEPDCRASDGVLVAVSAAPCSRPWERLWWSRIVAPETTVLDGATLDESVRCPTDAHALRDRVVIVGEDCPGAGCGWAPGLDEPVLLAHAELLAAALIRGLAAGW